MASYYGQTISDGWIKVFRHYSGNGLYFSSANSWAEAKLSNYTNPSADKFSILSKIDNIKIGDEYIFKLVFPNLGITNIWAQKSNPVLSTVGSAGVVGYRAISIQATNNGWGGLEYDGSNTFLDGSVNSTTWYYAVGATVAWGGTNTFPGPSAATNLVELWIKIR